MAVMEVERKLREDNDKMRDVSRTTEIEKTGTEDDSDIRIASLKTS